MLMAICGLPLVAPVNAPMLGRSKSIGVVLVLGLVMATADVSPNGVSLFGVAHAKQDGGSNGGGNRGGGNSHHDGGRGSGDGPGRSDDRDRGSDVSDNGSARGSAASVARAQERYARARGPKATAGHRGKGPDGSRSEHGRADVAHEFSQAETEGLIERGWQGPKAFDDGFRNHGQRVSTMVGIAKALGYDARVGAMQANFGTPFENRIYDLEVSLADTQAQRSAAPEDTSLTAEIERLTAELAAAIGLAKPGASPDDSWATVDLDVNDDLTVDERDLQAARAQTAEVDQEAQP